MMGFKCLGHPCVEKVESQIFETKNPAGNGEEIPLSTLTCPLFRV